MKSKKKMSRSCWNASIYVQCKSHGTYMGQNIESHEWRSSESDQRCTCDKEFCGHIKQPKTIILGKQLNHSRSDRQYCHWSESWEWQRTLLPPVRVTMRTGKLPVTTVTLCLLKTPTRSTLSSCTLSRECSCSGSSCWSMLSAKPLTLLTSWIPDKSQDESQSALVRR